MAFKLPFGIMKLHRIILFLSLIFVTGELFCQTNAPERKFLQGIARARQDNIDVIANGTFEGEVPCPPEYTNVVSNTKLFTHDEQIVFNDIVLNYSNEESNTVPPGTVLTSFKATPIHTSWGTNWQWIALFQFTNSDFTDEISPGGDLFRHKVRNKAGDGYDFNIIPTKFDLVPHDYAGAAGPEFWFQQIKHGVKDGLHVQFVHGDHCSSWMRYSNGWVVDKWLAWAPNKPYLITWAKFKEPFDLDRTHDRNLQAAVELVKVWATNAPNAVAPKPPTSAEELRSAFESGFKNKDLNEIISLYCWDGIERERKEMMGFGFAQAMTSSGTNTLNFTLASLPTKFQMTVSSFLPDWEGDDGRRGKYNIPVIGMLHLDFQSSKSADMPYGKKGDDYYIAQLVSYQIPGKYLKVDVFHDRGLTYTGFWTYVQGGNEISIPISNDTNSSKMGWGDYVKYCYVQRTSTDNVVGFYPNFEYTVIEDVTNTVFDSGPITNEVPVIYERK